MMSKMINFNEYGLYFKPADYDENSGKKWPTALVIPSLFEEYRCSHRLLYDTCDYLAENGVIALFPELTGLGNNEKELKEGNLKVWDNELKIANDFLLERSNSHTVIPFRIGALILGELSADRYIFWHPVINGQKFLRQLRVRREIQNKITGEVVLLAEGDLEGQIASRRLRDDLTDKIFALPKSGEIILTQQAASTALFTEYVHLLSENEGRNIKTNAIIADSYWYPHGATDYTDVIKSLLSEVVK